MHLQVFDQQSEFTEQTVFLPPQLAVSPLIVRIQPTLSCDPVAAAISGTPNEYVEPGPVVVELVDAYNSARADVSLSLLFHQGIPTLDRIGLVLLVALMLGVGFFGMRRFR